MRLIPRHGIDKPYNDTTFRSARLVCGQRRKRQLRGAPERATSHWAGAKQMPVALHERDLMWAVQDSATINVADVEDSVNAKQPLETHRWERRQADRGASIGCQTKNTLLPALVRMRREPNPSWSSIAATVPKVSAVSKWTSNWQRRTLSLSATPSIRCPSCASVPLRSSTRCARRKSPRPGMFSLITSRCALLPLVCVGSRHRGAQPTISIRRPELISVETPVFKSKPIRYSVPSDPSQMT